MFAALGKATAQLFAPELRRILWRVLFLTVALFAALWFGVGYGLSLVTLSDIGWLDKLAGWLGGLLGAVVTLILFAPVATAVAALFQDAVADAVEARHYPDLAPAKGLTIGRSIWAGVRLLAWTVLVNLLCLPLYLLPVANLAIFFAVNGLLLGREYYEAVALRRLSERDAAAFRRRHRIAFWLAGIVIAVLFWVPVANLLAPILGTALMVHRFEGLRRRAR